MLNSYDSFYKKRSRPKVVTIQRYSKKEAINYRRTQKLNPIFYKINDKNVYLGQTQKSNASSTTRKRQLYFYSTTQLDVT